MDKLFIPIGIGFLVVLIILFGTLALTGVFTQENTQSSIKESVSQISHAVEKHGVDEVTLVHECLDKKGPSQTWKKAGKFPGTQRIAYVCFLDSGHQAVRIMDEYNEEVTAFVRKRLFDPESIKDFYHYMRSSFWETCMGFCQ